MNSSWVFSLLSFSCIISTCISQTRVIPSEVSILHDMTSSGKVSDIIMDGYYSIEDGISISGQTDVHISSSDGAILDCVNNTHIFDIEPGSSLTLSNIEIVNCISSSIRSHDAIVSISNCTFHDNNGIYGGAIFSDGSDITILDSNFHDNNATQGGAVYISSSKTGSVLVYRSVFISNLAVEIYPEDYSIVFPYFTGGGALSVNDTVISVDNSTFIENHSSQAGGGVFISEGSMLHMTNCLFHRNTATKFGAGLSGSDMDVLDSSFTNNTCFQDGGGIYSWGELYINGLTCDSNIGEEKGGCLYGRGNTTLGEDNIMTGNRGYFGGSIYARVRMDILGGYFSDSVSSRNGGFMYITDDTVVNIYNATVSNCYAERRAGIVYVSGSNDDDGIGGKLFIHSGLFEDNHSGELGGGILAWGNTTLIDVSGGIFRRNYSPYSGGLFYLERFSSLYATSCLFEDNQSDDQGGAIYARDPTSIHISCDAYNNAAPQGSFVYLSHSQETSSITNSTIFHSSPANNVIFVARSVLYLINIDMTSGTLGKVIPISSGLDSILHLRKSTFRDWNGDSIVSNPNPDDNSLTITDCDFRNISSSSIVVSPSRSRVVNSIVNDVTLSQSEDSRNLALNSMECEDDICDGCIDNEFGVLCPCDDIGICNNGIDLEITILKEPIGIIYYPGIIEYELLLTNHDSSGIIWDLHDSIQNTGIVSTPSSGIIIPNDSIIVKIYIPQKSGKKTTSFVFDGPYIDKTENTLSVEHTFYNCNPFEVELSQGQDGTPTCSPCVTFFNSPNGEIGYDCRNDGTTLQSVSILPGFWRASRESIDIFKCGSGSSCIGGDETYLEDPYCKEGSTGPYCSVCEGGYSRYANGACDKCGDKQEFIWIYGTLTVLSTCFIFIIVILYLLDRLSLCKNKIKGGNKTRASTVVKILKKNSNKLKILIVVWQIIVIFPEIVNITYPNRYGNFIKGISTCLSFFNFHVDFLSSSCIFTHFNHYSNLIATTVIPLVVLCILGITFRVSMRINERTAVSVADTMSRHLYVGLVVTFIVFTSTSTVIFRTFICDTDAIPGKGFLRADLGVECFTSEHTLYSIYAGIMILLYPIGIPFMYFVLLYKNKSSLTEPNRDRLGNRSLMPYVFLWRDFKPNVYYFEVIECLRRVLLTGAIVLIDPNSPVQVTFACLMAFVSLIVFELIRPHMDNVDTWLYRLGCIIIFITNFMGLLLKIDYESQQSVIELLLIVLNIVLIGAIIVSIVLSVYMSNHEVFDLVDIVKSSKNLTTGSKRNRRQSSGLSTRTISIDESTKDIIPLSSISSKAMRTLGI